MVSPVMTVRGIIDTPILIAYWEGQPDAAQFIAGIRIGGLPEFSQLSAMALLVWCQDNTDRSAVEIFFRASVVHPVTAKLMRRAYRLLELLPPPSPLTAGDAIIAATAIEQSLPLYTLDPARFVNVPGLATLQPY